MPLVEIPLELNTFELPRQIADFINDAEGRIETFQQGKRRIAGLASANFHVAYRVLRELTRSLPPSENRFCEWGSGFGVVTCLARMLDFRACGIEIEPDLVAAARQLAADYDLDVAYHEGSYKPPGTYQEAVDETTMHLELGFRPMDFDVIFVYPWPAEENVVLELVDKFATEGTLLITYHGGGRVRLRRKV
jgi:predicted O-methyltransferase YrrM